jgi:hypothetical protein
MKANELISKTPGSAASIARQIVQAAAKAYVPEDLDGAVDKAVAKFAQQLKDAAKAEIRYLKIKRAGT